MKSITRERTTNKKSLLFTEGSEEQIDCKTKKGELSNEKGFRRKGRVFDARGARG